MIEAPDRVFVSPQGLEEVLEKELSGRLIERFGRLYGARGKAPAFFAQNAWLDPKIHQFESISKAAKFLRDIQRNWWLHSTHHHRRAQLIQEALPVIKPKPLEFGVMPPSSPLGSWTLLDENRILYSADCSQTFPDGELEFVENKKDPPSRAYLKLWEVFARTGVKPSAGEEVLDLGSSPGGWTWVLAQLGCQVTSVDKAPLADSVAAMKNVRFVSESAFGLRPSGNYQWLFSDVICYPERLLELVRQWEPVVPNLVCTIKFQGETNFAILKDFLAIPGSELVHLTNNKHELTWMRITSSSRPVLRA